MAAPQKEEKKLLEPTDNLITISNRKPANFFVYISKIYLKRFDTIELRALGNAAEVSVQVAENLSRFKFAVIEKIWSQTVELENKDQKMVNAIRFTIILRKSKDFEALVGDTLK